MDALAEAAPADGADLVLGHGLLEVVDDAASAVAALRQAAAPGAAVSVLVAGRYAAVLGRALGGRLAEARALLTDPDGRYGPHDALRRRLDTATLRALLEHRRAARSSCCRATGCIEGWVPGSVRDGGPAVAVAARAELDELAAAAEPLRDVAARLHALARRPGPPDGPSGPDAGDPSPTRPTPWHGPRSGPAGARAVSGSTDERRVGGRGTNGLLPFGWDRPRIRVSSDAAVPAASQITPLATRFGRDRPGRLTSPASRRAVRLVSSAVDAHPRALVASFRHHGR